MKNNNVEILEDLTTAINKIIFWREFTFNKNKFKLPNGDNAELADNVVWLDDTLFIFQTKQRNILSGDDNYKNDKWFQDEVLKKASKQIRDTLSFLEIHGDKQISNLCGLPFRIEHIKGNNLHKLILYGIDPLLSSYYKNIKCKISKTGGFIHLFHFKDYFTVCNTLITPAELNIYLNFRKNVIETYPDKSLEVPENALLGQFLSDEHKSKPSNNYIGFYDNFYNDVQEFDFSHLFDTSKNQFVSISGDDRNQDYYKIMTQFAKLKRAELKFLMPKLDRIVEEAKNGSKQIIENMMALDTDCAFFIGALPQFDKSNSEKVNKMLEYYTSLEKYHYKAGKCIGMFALGDKQNNNLSLLWCYIEGPWEYDNRMDKIENEKYPFKGQQNYSRVKSYRFKNDIN